MSYEFKHRTVLTGEPGGEDEDWSEVERLTSEGWEVFHTHLHEGCLGITTVVYLRNPVGFFCHTQSCPNCKQQIPK